MQGNYYVIFQIEIFFIIVIFVCIAPVLLLVLDSLSSNKYVSLSVSETFLQKHRLHPGLCFHGNSYILLCHWVSHLVISEMTSGGADFFVFTLYIQTQIHFI